MEFRGDVKAERPTNPIRQRVTRGLTVAVVVLLLATLAPPAARAQLDPLILGRAVDASVKLSIIVRGVVDGEDQIIWYAAGSGTIVSPGGLILTNQHLITPAGVEEKLAELEIELAAEGKSADVRLESQQFMVAISDGRHLPEPRFVARVVAEDEALDLAVLQIEGDERGGELAGSPLALPALPLGDSDRVNLGDPVHVFGFPAIGAGSLTYTAGVVSGFLYEEEIDGTAWINTDAVTSGGNSGGAAINAAGELIGIPSSGTALDCRPGDTNGDGVVGPEDVGCLPTGGSLAQLRPINLARPLLASVDPNLVSAVAAAPATATAGDAVASHIAAAEGCAARGDWRCAANFFAEALALSPGDATMTASLYGAYVALGDQEAAAGRLDSARAAFASATATDPTRADAAVALDRLAPYRRAIAIDGFDGPEQFQAASEGDAISRYEDGAFVIDVTQPGLVTGYPLTAEPLAGEDFAALLRVREAAGDGMITIEARTDPAGGQWIFAVDPTHQRWEVLQFDTAAGQFLPWSGGHAYGADAAAPLHSVELRVTDGFPLLFVNGIDVAALAGVSLPEIGNAGHLSFGALMSSEGVAPFTVAFDEIALYELM
jgi:S1-C subfamily serine protease